MSEWVEALLELFEREREAALRADLDALVELQELKRGVLDQLCGDGSGLPADQLAPIVLAAKSNLVLLRQLTSVHRALAGVDAASYGADGREVVGAPTSERGAL